MRQTVFLRSTIGHIQNFIKIHFWGVQIVIFDQHQFKYKIQGRHADA